MNRYSHRRRARSGAAPTAMLAVLALFVSACTGTRELQSSTLLLVSTAQAGTPQLVLVEDRQDGTPAGERMRFVAGSSRPLSAPAIAIDLTARELQRDTAWVLAREVAGTAVSAYLHRFAVADIDVTDPVAFAELGTALTLVEPGGGGVLPVDETTNTVICPSAVQSSRDGAWLLVLDVPADCVPSSSEFPVVWLVDTVAGTATSLQLDTPDPVVAAGPYTDQRQDDERGYFLVAGTTSTQVYATDLESGDTGWHANQLLAAQPLDLLAMAGRGRVLVALTDDQLVGVDLDLPATGSQLGPQPALTNGRKLVVDPLDRADHALVLGATQVEVHAGLAAPGAPAPDADRVNSFAAAAAAIDPFRAYAYVLLDGAVGVIDLYTGGDSGEPLRSSRFAVDELTLTAGPAGRPLGVINWVRAADPPALP